MTIAPPLYRRIKLTEFAAIFVPFGLLLAAALLLPERSQNVTQQRVAYTIWLATAMLIPGLSLSVLPKYFQQQSTVSWLCVAFAYVAYMVHFYITTFVVFGGIAGIFANMRSAVAITNVIVTVWWTIHMLMTLALPRTRRWQKMEEVVFYTFLFLVFVITDVVLRPTFVWYLGIALAASVMASLLVRLGDSTPLWPPPVFPARPLHPETPGMARSRMWLTFILLVVLMVAAHAAAEFLGYRDAQIRLTTPSRPTHTTLYYRIIFTIWATAILLTGALCAFILTRRDAPNSLWKGFWTVSYLAFVVHLYWAIAVMFRFNFHEILHSQIGVAKDAERIVQNAIPDLILAAWWTVDILLVWLCTRNSRWMNLQRCALHILAFVMFTGAFLFAEKASTPARLIGVVMMLAVNASLLYRTVVLVADPRSFQMTVFVRIYQFINYFVPWYRLPTWLGVINLGALREELRGANLHNTSDIPVTRPEGVRTRPPFDSRYLSEREQDGFYNNQIADKPEMGSASVNVNDPTTSSDFTHSTPGARFGRNIPLQDIGPLPTEKVLEPNPRLISRMLLAREPGKTVTADTLNLLAAAWIQFQTHDWFNHGTPVRGREFEIPLPPGDNWHQSPMSVRRTRPDPTRQDPNIPYPDTGPADGHAATYANAETHWWDASQVYGSSAQAVARLREGQGGKLRMNEHGELPSNCELVHLEETGLSANWWLGLSLLHNLFAKEHNAICDHLARAYPAWGDDDLFRVARLVNTALMVKIHTVDWTPAILGHPALQIGMNSNWWGMLTENVKKSLGRISENETFSGIPGSETDHHTADYCLTEEFVSVYRMHALMPDGVDIHSVNTGKLLRNLIFGSEIDDDPDDVVGPLARHRLQMHNIGLVDALYSFGIAKPGALMLQNYPNWMRRLRRLKGGQTDELIDLAVIDIVRDRERGVPRYNRFRESLHVPPFESLDEMIAKSQQLSASPKLAEALKQIYHNDVNQVDLMVGLYSETPPEGFGFSDTAFRLFILMASRRIKSDRFLTDDYTPAIYTQAGLDWIENNNMTSVLLRHYPQLTPAIQSVSNPFAPWHPIEA